MQWSRVASYGLVLVLAVELVVWEAFLTSARPFGTAFPVAAMLAVVGNAVLGVAGARVAGSRVGAVPPGVVWLLVALTLGSSRTEGDTVVPGSGRGYAFLLLGTVAAVAVVGLVPGRRAPVATPEAPDGR